MILRILDRFFLGAYWRIWQYTFIETSTFCSIQKVDRLKRDLSSILRVFDSPLFGPCDDHHHVFKCPNLIFPTTTMTISVRIISIVATTATLLVFKVAGYGHHHHGSYNRCKTKAPSEEEMEKRQKVIKNFERKRSSRTCTQCISIDTYFWVFQPTATTTRKLQGDDWFDDDCKSILWIFCATRSCTS